MTSHVYLLFSIGINYHSPCSYFSQSIPLYYHTIPMGKTHSIPKNFSIIPFISGWWFGTFGFFCHVLGISSSQLTNSIIFQRGRYATNQYIICYYWNFPTKISMILQVPHCFPLYPTLFPIKITIASHHILHFSIITCCCYHFPSTSPQLFPSWSTLFLGFHRVSRGFPMRGREACCRRCKQHRRRATLPSSWGRPRDGEEVWWAPNH